MTGLDEIMAEFYTEGKLPNNETAEEILDKMAQNNNYIPHSARREYRSVILNEYREYVKSQKDKIL